MTSSLAARGLEATAQKWEKHWSSALNDGDITYLINARCNLIRLPIGHFTLGPDFCTGTAFEGQPAAVYENAWQYVLRTCAQLRAAGIGVLIDLHALPGGANKDGHGGTSSGKAALWGNKVHLKLARSCHAFLAKEIAAGKIPNCVGLELCNEAVRGAKDLYAFYAEAIQEIAAVDSTIPIYISDGWDLKGATAWASKHNAAFGALNPVIVDTHTYYCHADADRACTPQQILERVGKDFAVDSADDVLAHGAAPLFVGEYSCVLDARTWSRVPPEDRAGLVHDFGHAQLERAYGHALGSAFWTLKMDWMEGGEWGFRAMTRVGAIGAPEIFATPAVEAEDRACEMDAERAVARADALGRFREYCTRECPGRRWAPARYDAGFDQGWTDALAFWTARIAFGLHPAPTEREAVEAGGPFGPVVGTDKIGCLDAWVLKRLRDVGPEGGTWEWERGFRDAAEDAENGLCRDFSSRASSVSTLYPWG